MVAGAVLRIELFAAAGCLPSGSLSNSIAGRPWRQARCASGCCSAVRRERDSVEFRQCRHGGRRNTPAADSVLRCGSSALRDPRLNSVVIVAIVIAPLRLWSAQIALHPCQLRTTLAAPRRVRGIPIWPKGVVCRLRPNVGIDGLHTVARASVWPLRRVACSPRTIGASRKPVHWKSRFRDRAADGLAIPSW